MSKKRNGVNWSKNPNAKHRRQGAMQRLQHQLKNGTKRNKDGEQVALTEKDEKRIIKEIEVLKERV